MPGDWPHAGKSRLLHNETKNGDVKFTDVTDDVPGLNKVGMVSGAIWTDADGDGWLDLVVTTDFGPLKLYRNTQGKLAEATAAAGLADVKGWWHGIAAADLDHDGDMDLIAGNLGFNTKYKQPLAGKAAPDLLRRLR